LVTRAIIIYVHLGSNPSPTLVHMALGASKSMKEASLMLVTDHVENFGGFPGQIIEYSKSFRTEQFREFIKKNKELQGISGGYWLFTLERLFALQHVAKSLPKDIPIIHFESDVYSFLNIQDISELSNYYKNVAVPRIDKNTGIASIVYAPNQELLITCMDNLMDVLTENPSIKSDMTLLGQGLNLGVLEELRSRPDFDDRLNQPRIILDGAELGQYFFGVDPLHTGGILQTGFTGQGTQIKFDELKFILQGKPKSLYIKHLAETVKVGCIHNHAKRILINPEDDPATWNRLLREANHEVARISEIAPLDLIHTKKVSVLNRIRRARKSNENFLKYLLKKIIN
jgi:hypothetical protein